MSHPALTQLRALRYFDALPALDPQQLDWLLLEDSMTKRFEQQGKQVTVTLIQEGFVTSDMLDGERHLLLIKGSVPGAKNGLVYVRRTVKPNK